MIQLDDWQNEVLACKGDFLLCTGRRVGKTHIMAHKAALRLVEKPNTQIVVVSLTEDQAKLIISMCLDSLTASHKKLIAKGLKKPTQVSITLTNKSKIIARPVGNTGDAVRGFNGDILIVDEASRMPDLMWIAAKPILLTTGGEIWMCSTPFGKEGYFWEAFNASHNKKDPDARFKVFYKSSEEVIHNRPISESWTEKQRTVAIRNLDLEKKDMSEMEYGQEYMGLFLEELRRFFSDKIITERCIAKRPDIKIEETNYYLGVDIARMGNDDSTFETIMRINERKFQHIDNEITSKTLTYETENNILRLNRIYNYKRIGLDAGAGTLGVSIHDHLLLNGAVARKLVALNNRSIALDRDGKKQQRLLKEDLYNNLLSMMEQGIIDLLDDDSVKNSLASVQYEYLKTPGQMTKIRIFGRDTHIVEGLIRAAYLAYKEKGLNFGIHYV